MKFLHSKESRRELINSIIAIIIGFVFLFPIYWLLQISFKSDAETFGRVLTYFPHEFTIDPWLANLQDREFVNSLVNSFLNALLTMGITLLLGIPAAYGMGRYRVKTTNLFLLGNHFAAPMAIACGSIAFCVVTLRPYFKSVPVALDEAARLDGCGTVRAFMQVMIPAVKTGIITIMVISFLNGWNDLVFSQTFNVQPELRPLTANIFKFQNAYGTRWNAIMAYGSILVLPVVLMFIFLQKYIVGGLTAGAVKE